MPPVTKVEDQNNLVPTKSYPFGHWKFENFNPVQSRMMDFYDKETSGLIAATTSSGKTVVAEIFLAQEIHQRGGKGMYLVPMRALAQEKIDEWTDEKHHFGKLKISICTGDYRLTKERAKELEEADLIIMTSEMLNHRSRNFKAEQNNFLKNVGTIIVDESHLLTVPGRGDHLEVGLMKFTQINPTARVIMLSATMPNVEEIADWVAYSLTKRDTFVLRSKFRPVPLTIHYEPYSDDLKRYDLIEEEKVNKGLDIIEWYKDDKFLVFAHTKRTGEIMKRSLKSAGIEAEFHNADLGKQERISLEQRFKNEKTPRVVVATSTLAWGCYAKGTTVLMQNGLKKIEDVKVGDFVLASSDNGMVPRIVEKVGQIQPIRCLKFTLSTGEQVIVSEDHKFYGAFDRENVGYYMANKFSQGDYLAIPLSESPILVDATDEGYLQGYIMGDGSKTDCGVFSDGQRKEVLDICFGSHELIHCQYIRKLFQNVYCHKFGKTKTDSNGVLHLNTKQRDIVEKFVLPKAGRQKSSMSLFDLKNSDFGYLRGVLQGLFDTDGGFSFHNRNNVSIEFTTISEQLARDVQQILFYFGVKATVGKKRMKDSVIKGRLQKAKRDFIFRVRIYSEFIPAFLKYVGFRNCTKNEYGKYVVSNILSKKCFSKDFIPARHLLEEHAAKNSISPSKMMKQVRGDYWNVLNKQEITRNKCKEIIEKFPVHSSFSNLISSNLKFSKITSIEEVPNCPMYDLQVHELHNYVGGGVLSHNCNLPARRVVILGVHRGLQEVESYDILQMIGRSGRLGIDPMGDAYILVPESKEREYRAKYSKAGKIESQLLEKEGPKYKTLAFHLVSEIHHGNIETTDDVHEWYKRSLGYFQNKSLDKKVVDDTLDVLKKCGAIAFEEDKWIIRPIGKVSSMFYFSPFDTSDLYFNFKNLFTDKKENDDLSIAMALGNIDSQRTSIVTKFEKEEIKAFQSQINITGRTYMEGAMKAGFCYFNLLNGVGSQACSMFQRSLQYDFSRISQILQALDSFGGRGEKNSFYKNLEGRIVSGVPAHLVELCRVPNIGKVRANRLFAKGIKTIDDLAGMSLENFKSVANIKGEMAEQILKDARKISFN